MGSLPLPHRFSHSEKVGGGMNYNDPQCDCESCTTPTPELVITGDVPLELEIDRAEQLRTKFAELFGIDPNFTGVLSSEHYIALQRVDEETMREITEKHWRSTVLAEVERVIGDIHRIIFSEEGTDRESYFYCLGCTWTSKTNGFCETLTAIRELE
jgi:hypothetical protein